MKGFANEHKATLTYPSPTNLHFSLLPSIHLIYTQCNKLSINRQINHGTSAYHKKPTDPIAISLFCQDVKIVQKHKHWETDSGQPCSEIIVGESDFSRFASLLARSCQLLVRGIVEIQIWSRQCCEWGGGRGWESTRLIVLLIRARLHLPSSSLASWSELGGDWGDDDEDCAGGR